MALSQSMFWRAAALLLAASGARAFLAGSSTGRLTSPTRHHRGATARATTMVAAPVEVEAAHTPTLSEPFVTMATRPKRVSWSEGNALLTTQPAASALTGFDLKAYMYERLGRVEAALDDSLHVTCPEVKIITESMRYSLLAGGKRIRPIMCIAACEMFGGSEEDAMATAVAIEMIHSMSLIHDDLPSMDDDDFRRGKPTNHKVYGEPVAILAGDALLSQSFEHVAKFTPKTVPAERIVEVIRRLGEAVGPVGLAGGQVMDLECEGKPLGEVSLEELRWIHLHKTAKLLQVSCTAGAILAGANEQEVQAVSTYADDIGLAFQVADDILDVTATSEELGKTAGKDLEADKTTYPKLLTLDGARAEARRLYDEAVESLEPFGERATPLLAIAEYIIERQN